jgi:hypothetical protein
MHADILYTHQEKCSNRKMGRYGMQGTQKTWMHVTHAREKFLYSMTFMKTKFKKLILVHDKAIK